MSKNKFNYKLLNILMITIIVYLVINTFEWWSMLLNEMFALILPFLIAFIVAYSLYPCVKKLEELGIRKWLALSSVILTVFCIIILLFYITVPLMYNQFVLLLKIVENVITDLSYRFGLDLGTFKDTICIGINGVIKNLGGYISNGVFNLLSKSIDFITKCIITFVVSIYLLIDMDKIKYKIRLIFKRLNKKILKYVETIDNAMCNYLQGLFISIVIQFIEYSILFFIIGHPNWLLLSLLASLTSIIPYFGTLLTNIIAVVLASAVSFKLFILTAIICLVFPNIDGYIISPKIYGKTNNINPIWTIFAVFVGGTLGGMFGIIIAVPIYVIINCTYNFFKKDIYGKIDNLM